jgi:hypothetical protein
MASQRPPEPPFREKNLKAGDCICVDAFLSGIGIMLALCKSPQQNEANTRATEQSTGYSVNQLQSECQSEDWQNPRKPAPRDPAKNHISQKIGDDWG